MPFNNNEIIKENILRDWPNTAFHQHVDDLWETLQSPEVPRDGIPPLDHPYFQTIQEAKDNLTKTDALIVVNLEGEEVKAYRIDDVMLHEIVNDKINDEPIAVTFCPLCNSAIVYRRKLGNHILRLGVSGMLRHNDLIMWDDLTESWWQQMTGEGIAGSMTGQQLEMLPSTILNVDQLSTRYPHAKVLKKTDEDPLPPSHQTGDFKERGPKMVNTEKVMAAMINEKPFAIHFDYLKSKRMLNVEFEGSKYVVFLNDKIKDMGIEQDQGQALMYQSSTNQYTVLHFYIDEHNNIKDKETESAWNLFGEAESGPLKGEVLEQVTLYPHFKEPWFTFHPNTSYIKSR